MAAELNWKWAAFQRTALQDLLTGEIPNELLVNKNTKYAENISNLSVWKNKEFQDGLQNSLNWLAPVESNKKAEELRLEGNGFFKKKCYQKALSCYSKAILHASDLGAHSSPQLCLAYANRSAALYHLQKWELAIKDVGRAIAHGYPAEQQYKLLIRRGECLIHEGNKDGANEALELALKCLSESALSASEVTAKEERIARLLTSCVQLGDDRTIYKESRDVGDGLMKENPRLQNASEQLTLSYSQEKGRYLLANTIVSAGDVIIREIPFAVVLLPEHHETHCHYCCRRTLAPIMCSRCIHVQYCSELCKDTAWSKHHQIECPMLDILNQVGTFGHLSLRIVLNAGIHEAPSIKLFLDRVSSTSANHIPGCRADGSYCADYEAVYSLQTHMEKQPVENVLKAALDGFLLSLCMYLVLHKDSPIHWETLLADPDVCALATLICHHILQLRCNVHAITSVLPQEDATNDSAGKVVVTTEQTRIASAIFPTTSLMNHGCEPNVMASFNDHEIRIRATRHIERGEEICHCYGPHVNHMSVTERQRTLKDQYYFTCKCSACSSTTNKACDWSRAFRCSRCYQPARLLKSQLKCTKDKCGHQEDAAERLKLKGEAEQLFEEGMKLMEEGSHKKCLGRLLQSLNIHERVFFKHHRTVAEVHDSLARCYAEIGDFSHSAEHLDKAIVIVRKIYGEDSIELAQELHKLAQILFNGQQIDRAKAVISEALPLLSRHHGNSHETVQELLEMQTCLMSLR